MDGNAADAFWCYVSYMKCVVGKKAGKKNLNPVMFVFCLDRYHGLSKMMAV